MTTIISHMDRAKQKEVKDKIDGLIENIKKAKAHYQEFVDIMKKQTEMLKMIRVSREPLERIRPIAKWHDQNYELLQKALEVRK